MEQYKVVELLAQRFEDSDAGLVGLFAFDVGDHGEAIKNRAWTTVGRLLRNNPPELSLLRRVD